MCPAYLLDDFIDACAARNVFVRRDPKNWARENFNLPSKDMILTFIANGGLQQIKHDHTKEWELCPQAEKPIMVDSYFFRSGGRSLYIAFFYRPAKNRWEIKSFKENENRNLVMQEQLSKIIQRLEHKGN